MTNTVQKFLLNDLDVRGAIVHLDTSWQDVLKRRAYPADITELLGQATAATLLMGANIKYEGKIMLQLQSPSELNLLVVQNDNHFNFRSIIQYQDYENTKLTEIAKGGLIAIMVEAELGKEPYQGIVSIDNDDLASNVETYFNQSEQLKTMLVLRADTEQSAGILLQVMPSSNVDEDEWERLRHVAETLNLSEMKDIDCETMITRIFAEDDKTVYEPEKAAFDCVCSDERTLSMLASLDKSELEEIVEAEETVEIGCDFCGKQYEHDPTTISALLANKINPN